MVSCWFRQSTRNAVASHICEPGAALREPPIRRYPFAWSFFRSGLAETLNPTMIDRRDVPVTGLTDAELFAVAAGGLPEPREDSKMLLLPPAQSTRQPSICFQKPRSRTPVARTGLRRIKIRKSQFDCASYRDHGVRLRSLVRNPGFFGGCWWNAGVRSAATISPVARLAGSP